MELVTIAKLVNCRGGFFGGRFRARSTDLSGDRNIGILVSFEAGNQGVGALFNGSTACAHAFRRLVCGHTIGFQRSHERM